MLNNEKNWSNVIRKKANSIYELNLNLKKVKPKPKPKPRPKVTRSTNVLKNIGVKLSFDEAQFIKLSEEKNMIF